jgi:hypothetical protein
LSGARRLIAEGVITSEEYEKLDKEVKERFGKEFSGGRAPRRIHQPTS